MPLNPPNQTKPIESHTNFEEGFVYCWIFFKRDLSALSEMCLCRRFYLSINRELYDILNIL